MPGSRRGTILLPGLPENTPFESNEKQPLPTNIAEAIWITLTHMDQKLASLKPTVNRGIDGIETEAEDEPTWVKTFDKGLCHCPDRADKQFTTLKGHGSTSGPFRMAFVLKGVREDAIPDIRVFASDRDGG